MEERICIRCGKKKYMFSLETMCFPCRKEKELEYVKEAITTGKKADTGSSYWVICPYCGNGISHEYGYEDFPELYEEGDHEIHCDECEKDFIMETTISYYYETRKKEEKDEE